MTTPTLRRIKDNFVVTGPDIEPTRGMSGTSGRGVGRRLLTGGGKEPFYLSSRH
jgi:hypothetical protein